MILLHIFAILIKYDSEFFSFALISRRRKVIIHCHFCLNHLQTTTISVPKVAFPHFRHGGRFLTFIFLHIVAILIKYDFEFCCITLISRRRKVIIHCHFCWNYLITITIYVPEVTLKQFRPGGRLKTLILLHIFAILFNIDFEFCGYALISRRRKVITHCHFCWNHLQTTTISVPKVTLPQVRPGGSL